MELVYYISYIAQLSAYPNNVAHLRGYTQLTLNCLEINMLQATDKIKMKNK